ncbi:MAG: IS30 family transposase [Bacteroidales bacterium]|nr:IS30 family transposase [Bacteroidales bacterium]
MEISFRLQRYQQSANWQKKVPGEFPSGTVGKMTYLCPDMKHYTHLTSEQRYTIFVLLRQKKTKAEIARTIGVSQSTVYRELAVNSTTNGRYYYKDAQMFSDDRRKKCRKPVRLTPQMQDEIVSTIRRLRCSPDCVRGKMLREGRDCVCVERIYQLVRQDKADGGNLWTFLPNHLKHRRRYVSKGPAIKNRVSIDQRPAIVAERGRFGDWEMDTIVGPGGRGVIVTLVERLTKKTLMAKCPKGKNARALARVVVGLLLPFADSVLTITTDNGSEFADHEYISRRLGCQIFFAHPYASWQKGLIENTNKIIRQFIPKNTDLRRLSPAQISDFQSIINLRPRKKLNYTAPKSQFLLYLHHPSPT